MITELSDKEYDRYRKFVYDHIGISLGENKKELLRTRTAKRLRILQIDTFDEYFTYINAPENAEELANFFDVISTNKTSFFRESHHFDFLNNVLLPDLVRRKLKGNSIKVSAWSAACSTGDEPYTIALTLDHFLRNYPARDIKVLATDISTRVLEKAEKGLYPADALTDVPRNLLLTYFRKGTGENEGFFQVDDAIKRLVYVRRLNLMAPRYPFKQKFDFIFCRNVLIYFDRPTQKEMADKLYRYLADGGYLFLGHAESLSNVETDFEFIQPTIYRKN